MNCVIFNFDYATGYKTMHRTNEPQALIDLCQFWRLIDFLRWQKKVKISKFTNVRYNIQAAKLNCMPAEEEQISNSMKF